MCGRFVQYRPTRDYARALGLRSERLLGDLVARYNVAPSEAPLVARIERPGEQAVLAPMTWGFVPHWAREDSRFPRPINARAETVASKPMFRAAFRGSRALVPADAYFEWGRVRGHKQPYCFRRQSDEPMFFAAVWATHMGENGPTPTFAIIVGPANELAKHVHDRAPAVIEPENYQRWLDPGYQDVAALEQLLVPPAAEAMEYFAVSTSVNNAKNKSEDCVSPIGPRVTL